MGLEKKLTFFFCIPPFLWGGSISGPHICNVNISDCLCTVTVKVLISAVEMGDQDFSMFPATHFLLSPFLIYCSLCFGGVFFCYILSHIFVLNVLSCIGCVKVLICFDQLSLTSQRAGMLAIFSWEKEKNILMCGSVPCFKHLLQKCL